MSVNGCSVCLVKQRRIDDLKEEVKSPGAKPGHKGVGRKSHADGAIDRKVVMEAETETCPECGRALEKKGWA